MADIINMWAIFTSMVLLPTRVTGSLGKWLVQLPLRCDLGLRCRNTGWIYPALWLSHLMSWLRCCLIDRLLSYPCSFFCFLSHLDYLDKCKPIIFELEESFEDCFIFHGQMNLALMASSSASLIDRMSHVTASCHILLKSVIFVANSVSWSGSNLYRIRPDSICIPEWGMYVDTPVCTLGTPECS